MISEWRDQRNYNIPSNNRELQQIYQVRRR